MATQRGLAPEMVQVLASYFAQNGSPGFPVQGAQPMMSETPEAMQPLMPHSVPDPWGGQPIQTFVPPVAGGFQAPQAGGGAGGGMPLALLAGMAAQKQGQMPGALAQPRQPYHPGAGNMTVQPATPMNMMAPPQQPQSLATLIQALSGLRR
jgi:hypothetical protein